MTTKIDKNLLEKIKQLLDKENHTISSLREKLHLQDEYEIIKVIGKLETDNKISLKGFETIYREDGGEIHLAVYGKFE